MASRFSRFTSFVNNAIKGIGRTFGGQPSTVPPQQVPYEPEPVYTEPPLPEEQEYIEVDDESIADEEVEQQDQWYGNEITIWNQYGEPFSATKQEWQAIVLNLKEDLIDQYGMDNLDIIRALVKLGVWNSADWRTWRQAYDLAHGFPAHTRRQVA